MHAFVTPVEERGQGRYMSRSRFKRRRYAGLWKKRVDPDTNCSARREKEKIPIVFFLKRRARLSQEGRGNGYPSHGLVLPAPQKKKERDALLPYSRDLGEEERRGGGIQGFGCMRSSTSRCSRCPSAPSRRFDSREGGKKRRARLLHHSLGVLLKNGSAGGGWGGGGGGGEEDYSRTI